MADDSYFKKHASAMYAGGLLLLGILLFIVGVTLKQWVDTPPPNTHSDQVSFLAKVGIEACTQSGVTLVLLVATILFFNIHDTRTTMSQGVVALFTDGDIAKFFSSETKERLQKVLTLDQVSQKIQILPEDLYSDLYRVEKKMLELPLARGVNWAKTITKENKEHKSLYRYDCSLTFDLSTEHMRDKKCTHDFGYTEEVAFDGAPTITLDEWFERLTILVGSDTFHLDNAQVKKTHVISENRHTYKLEFQHQIHIVDKVSISVQAVHWKPKLTYAEFFRLSVPAYQPAVSVTFPPDHTVLGVWLATQSDLAPGPHFQRNSCRMTYKGWLLAMEGAAFYQVP